jgi:hypothetical protein
MAVMFHDALLQKGLYGHGPHVALDRTIDRFDRILRCIVWATDHLVADSHSRSACIDSKERTWITTR